MYVIVYGEGKLTNYAYYKSLTQVQAVIDKWIIDDEDNKGMYRIETLRPGDRA